MTTFSTVATQRHVDRALKRYFPGSSRSQHDGRSAYGQTMSGSAVVAEFLKLVGVEIIFGIPGGASLPLNDALTHAHVDGAFRYVLTGHEQGAAFEAEGYAAASGKIGLCTATSGPGATNLVTGLADAFRDSRPVLALTGNTATTAEPEAFQAIDIVGITDGKATKASFRPEKADDVQEIIVRAYHIAITGRPGSVLIDLPKDVQSGPTTLRPWEEIIAQFDWSVPAGDPELIRQATEWLQTAERPVLYVGNGAMIAHASAEIQALAREYQIPVVTTVHAIGVLPADDALNLGMIGMHGTVVANLAAHRADLLIALGARFDDRVAGANPARFAPSAKVVHVDVDPYQLNRVRKVDLAIHGDLKVVLQQLLGRL
ncbi:MAG TPA: thiamine pyrophosphate-binding protein [Chloroflexota bacterium]|nr:thiamine pyrophosphate-binding protein [Chloroflexota bacterium]